MIHVHFLTYARHLLVERHLLDGPGAFAGLTASAQPGSDTRIILESEYSITKGS